MDHRLDEWISRGFVFLLSVVAIWIGSEIKKMSDSVTDLNTKFAVMIEQQKTLKETQDKHETRIERLESKKDPDAF